MKIEMNKQELKMAYDLYEQIGREIYGLLEERLAWGGSKSEKFVRDKLAEQFSFHRETLDWHDDLEDCACFATVSAGTYYIDLLGDHYKLSFCADDTRAYWRGTGFYKRRIRQGGTVICDGSESVGCVYEMRDIAQKHYNKAVFNTKKGTEND